jgi:hypothetical protein
LLPLDQSDLACNYNYADVIGDNSCNGDSSCSGSFYPGDTVGVESCVGENACREINTIDIGSGSCLGESACDGISKDIKEIEGGACIGDFACSCDDIYIVTNGTGIIETGQVRQLMFYLKLGKVKVPYAPCILLSSSHIYRRLFYSFLT